MEDERFESTENEQENPDIRQENIYTPRPMWQVWAARVGLVIVIIGVILYLYRIATGGM